VQGTATHPIEFSVTLSMVLPIATHFALFAQTRKDRVTWWLTTGTILTAVIFSLSRSGIIGLVVGMGALLLVWNNRLRLEAAMVAVAGAVAYKAVLPGLLGTIRSLFLNLGNDPSVQGRTDDYQHIGRYIAERPWFGRGPRTFLRERYFALDNQFLDTLITTGWIGVASLVTLFVVSVCVARGVYRRAVDESARHLGQALAGSLLAALVTSLTFDSLSFVGFFGVFFVVVGAAGALRRLEPTADEGEVLAPLVRLRKAPLPPRRSSGGRAALDEAAR
jgi:O-antigen ligase